MEITLERSTKRNRKPKTYILREGIDIYFQKRYEIWSSGKLIYWNRNELETWNKLEELED